jgi:hypothetical protein
MRRALIGIVPDALLNRKRKAYVTRSPFVKISNEWTSLLAIEHHMATASFGIINAGLFFEELKTIRRRQAPASLPVLRAIGIEEWLRNVVASGVMCPVDETLPKSPRSFISKAARSWERLGFERRRDP